MPMAIDTVEKQYFQCVEPCYDECVLYKIITTIYFRWARFLKSYEKHSIWDCDQGEDMWPVQSTFVVSNHWVTLSYPHFLPGLVFVAFGFNMIDSGALLGRPLKGIWSCGGRQKSSEKEGLLSPINDWPASDSLHVAMALDSPVYTYMTIWNTYILGPCWLCVMCTEVFT